jgi:hypothetical protein
MRSRNFNVVNFEGLVDQFMSAREPFPFQADAVKVYPLSLASSRIQCPTPLFKLDHNFLLLFEEGGGEQQVDNDMIELTNNDVLFIREGHLNSVKSITPGTSGYYIHIDSVLLPRIFTDTTLLHRLTFHPRHAVSMRSYPAIVDADA